ncbi:hypothetical protein PPYR_08077 [Photinus pyralis]|uniref:FLYWCH-type domain-containing protein n=1 Tax=Photinus pyralis TaxID=7054 RepID=A0A5N4AIF9_PHOPY|nr:hypothetical protein PPYR_08077 [Photinus pyralis]
MAELLSQRGGLKIAHHGHLFSFHKKSSDGTLSFWRCDKRTSENCKARLHTDANGDGHAETTLSTPANIISEALQDVGVATRGQLPSKCALKKVVQRRRNILRAAPVQPDNLAALIIPPEYTQYEFQRDQFANFLLHDSGERDNERILIFGRSSYGNWSQEMKKMYVDGTFRIATQLFGQVYVVMAERGVSGRRIDNNDADFALAARKIVALAFVPIDNLDDAFEELSESTPVELEPILHWFAYIGRPNRRGNRRESTFPPELWTVFERTLNGDARTNNIVEAAHRALQAEMGMDHPTLWKFIDSLKKVQSGRDQTFEEYIRGDGPIPKRRKYIQADNRILNILQDRNNRTHNELLQGIADNFLMN